MDENRLYPKQFCDLASMLSSCAAKTCESVQRISAASAAKESVRGTYTCFPVAYPLASVRARIGLHMVSFATLMNLPIKSASRDKRNLGDVLTHMLLHRE